MNSVNFNTGDKISNLEILAPAGSVEVLKAAVFSGANAVYIGGDMFSARASATNFSREDIKWAADFCTVRGVKLFVAVNTLIKNEEFPALLDFIEFLCETSVSAVIVQDMGVFNLIRKIAPDLVVHISTQSAIVSKSGARLMKNMGAKRVVLARELSLLEIDEINKACDIEIETFVHGALCMCLSGRCYFSAVLGGRSGNRGRCAQPCRLPFFAKGTGEYSLSLKDLSFIENVDKLRDVGVNSLKIEGRMKRAEYVAAACTCADFAVNGKEIPDELKKSLEAAFSRSGFTDGYLTGKIGKDMFGVRTKEDVTAANAKVYSSLRNLYKNERQSIPLNIEFTAIEGEFAKIIIKDSDENTVLAQSLEKTETAINVPLSKEKVLEQLAKLGGTPYFAQDICVNLSEKASLPISKINALRREAIEKITSIREKRVEIKCGKYNKIQKANKRNKKIKYRALFQNIAQMPKDLSFFEKVYLPLSEPITDFLSLKENGVNVAAYTPQSFFGKEDVVRALIKNLKEHGINEFLCSDLSCVQICKELGVDFEGAYSLNVMNDEALEFFCDLGIKNMELSFEMSKREIDKINTNLDTGVMVYGRQSLMTVRNCPLTNSNIVCKNKGNCQSLTDRKNVNFPIQCKHYEYGKEKFKSVEILNSTPLSLSDSMDLIKNLDFGILRFTIENEDEVEEVINCFRQGIKPIFSYTKGLFNKGIL